MLDITAIVTHRDDPDGAFAVRNDILKYEPNVPVLVGAEEGRGIAATRNDLAKGAHTEVLGFFDSQVTVRRGFSQSVQNHFTDSGLQMLVSPVLFVRRAWFERVGGFDEQFQMFRSEEDLVRRAGDDEIREVRFPFRWTGPLGDELLLRHHQTREDVLFARKWGD